MKGVYSDIRCLHTCAQTVRVLFYASSAARASSRFASSRSAASRLRRARDAARAMHRARIAPVANGARSRRATTRATTRIATTRIATTTTTTTTTTATAMDDATRTAKRARRATRRRRATARTTTTTRAKAKNAKEREIDAKIDATTRKWGLEAGLWKVFKSGGGAAGGTETDEGASEGAEELGTSRMDMAKKLLKRYGSAYLATSISLSLISITVFYFLVAGGVDVASLLDKIGISVNATSEQFGTFALAYAAHKASSPIRFGPTVALTPMVAKWFGKEVDDEDEDEGEGEDRASE